MKKREVAAVGIKGGFGKENSDENGSEIIRDGSPIMGNRTLAVRSLAPQHK
jgi:hypothetical protein